MNVENQRGPIFVQQNLHNRDMTFFGKSFLEYAIANYDTLIESNPVQLQGRPSMNACYASIISVLHLLSVTEDSDYEDDLEFVSSTVTNLTESIFLFMKWKNVGLFQNEAFSALHPRHVRFVKGAKQIVESSHWAAANALASVQLS